MYFFKQQEHWCPRAKDTFRIVLHYNGTSKNWKKFIPKVHNTEDMHDRPEVLIFEKKKHTPSGLTGAHVV
jgi:hypothetical protein